MEHSHKAIIKGRIERKLYRFGNKPYKYYAWQYPKELYENNELIREDVIWQGELDMPVLKYEDCIYIQELETTVRITSCLRTTENKYIYTTSHVIETFEDELTEKSWKEALEREQEYLSMQDGFKESEKLKEEKCKPWYKRLFGK